MSYSPIQFHRCGSMMIPVMTVGRIRFTCKPCSDLVNDSPRIYTGIDGFLQRHPKLAIKFWARIHEIRSQI